jgi:tetratricopeptide (TPR) repeat protein
MIQMLFFLRFRSQLRRTRPQLIADLDDTIALAAANAGGRLVNSRRCLSILFGEEKPAGRRLDLLIFLETLHKALEKNAAELYGHALVLGRDIPEAGADGLCRSLSASPLREYTGIWCSQDIQKDLAFYGVFENSVNKTYKGYGELKYFKKVEGRPAGIVFPCREKIEKALAQGGEKNTLVLGPEFIGKRDGVYHYCAGLLGKIPPLAIRFGAGGRGLVCFADALTPEIRSFLSGSSARLPPETLKELESLRNLLFGERLREELSPYVVEEGRRFLRTLLIAYRAASKSQAVMVIENPETATDEAALLFNEVFNSLEDRRKYLVLGVSDTPEGENLKNWKGIFPRMLKYNAEDYPVREKTDLSEDLLEMAYGIALLARYFPAWLFEDLFEEEGIHPLVYRRALEIFAALGVADRADPRPRIPDFISRVEKMLGPKKEGIRGMVRNRLLAWVDSGKLRPCFNLLRILSELGGEGGDAVTLKSLRGDIFNGTCDGIKEAVRQRYFARLVGAKNAGGFLWVYKTLRALGSQGIKEIREAFSEAPPRDVEYTGLRFQILANQTSFSLGIKDIAAASSTAKEAMLLNQELKGGSVSAYRYFSLVNLSRQRLDDALEYSSFAMEQAEKTEPNEESILSAYFAAGAQFLYGNLSKAGRFALKAEEASVKLGHIEWAGRARFLRGKIRFETGCYAEALEIFDSLADQSGGDPPSASGKTESAKAETLAAWTARARVFLKGGKGGFPSALPRKLPCSDGPLFEIEAACAAGNYSEAVVLAEKWRAAEPGDDDFLFTEQPDWRSGFAQCELMLIPGKIFRNRFVSLYQAMARSGLETSREGREELVNGVQRLLREDLLANTDPNEAFYLYALYRILKETGAAQVDLNTAVSMAFKRLQRRAGRIDDDGTRQIFLTRHHWNGALSLAAREYKLI